MASKFKGNSLTQKIKFYLKSHLSLVLIVVGISLSVITFVVVVLTRQPTNLDKAVAQDAPIRSSTPGGFVIPRAEDESSSSSISLSVSSISSSLASSISSFSSSLIPSSSSQTSFSSNSFSSSSISSFSNSSTSNFSSSSISSFSISSSLVSSSFSSNSFSSSVSLSAISNSSSSRSNSSSSVFSNLSTSNSSLSQNSFISNNSISTQGSNSSIVNFDPNNPGTFGNPSKGDPAVPTSFTPTTTVRSGGFSTFAIILGVILLTGGYVYYRQSGNKSLLSTTEKKLKK